MKMDMRTSDDCKTTQLNCTTK